MSWGSIVGQLAIQALPTLINAGQSAAQNLQQNYQQAVETYMNNVKEYNNIIMKDLEEKRKKESELFQKLRESNQEKSEKQESFASAWSKALNSEG
jgi:ribosomal protein RSM22 (predicted rRNA methylase)